MNNNRTTHRYIQQNGEGYNKFIEIYGTIPSENYLPYTKGMLNRLGNNEGASDFMKEQYDLKAGVFWNRFYTNNKTNFFKDRHWIVREFPELNTISENSDKRFCLMEAGCGVGNTFFPLVQNHFPELKIYAFDFSKQAVELIKEHELYVKPKYENQITAFVHDLTADCGSIPEVPDQSVDFVTLVFVLSAISPHRFKTCVSKIYNSMKVGGIVFVRDYARDDLAQNRFTQKETFKKLSECFYVRGDGTRAYYFTIEEMEELFLSSGKFEKIQCDVCEKEVVNVKEQKHMARKFIQARFRKIQ